MHTSGISFGLVLPNWVAGDDVAALVEAAIAAEDGGWDGVFLADHLVFPPPPSQGQGRQGPRDMAAMPFPDPWIALSAIAARTSRIRLGTWVTPIPRRQPWQLARDLATVDRLSGGRVMLGAGVGRRSDYDAFGETWNLAEMWRRFDEAVELVDAFWQGEPVQHRGPHYTVEDVTLLPTPVQRPRIPIVVGGIWPSKRSLIRGARWDGIAPHVPGDGVIPPDGKPIEKHLRAVVGHYLSLTNKPAEVWLPLSPPHAGEGYVDFCRNLGATWLYQSKVDGDWSLAIERIRRGPPSQP